MGEDFDNPGGPSGGLSRRTMLKRAGAGAAAVWVAPAILSVPSASAASPVAACGVCPVCGPNLIVNPGAEAGTAGYTTVGNFTTVSYAAGGGFPTNGSPGPPSRGTSFFAGGVGASSSGTQVIDVSAAATAIDALCLTYSLSGYLGGFAGQGDNARATITFLNSGNSPLGSAVIGPVTPADRGGVTGLFLRSTTGAVPAGTRSIEFVILMTRIEGTFNDGYADEFSLVLSN